MPQAAPQLLPHPGLHGRTGEIQWAEIGMPIPHCAHTSCLPSSFDRSQPVSGLIVGDGGGALESVQGIPRQQSLNRKEIYYPGVGGCLWIRQKQAARSSSRWFLFVLVFAGVTFLLRRKGEVSARESWKVLTRQVSQCSQIMKFDSWTLVFSLRKESAAK